MDALDRAMKAPDATQGQQGRGLQVRRSVDSLGNGQADISGPWYTQAPIFASTVQAGIFYDLLCILHVFLFHFFLFEKMRFDLYRNVLIESR